MDYTRSQLLTPKWGKFLQCTLIIILTLFSQLLLDIFSNSKYRHTLQRKKLLLCLNLSLSGNSKGSVASHTVAFSTLDHVDYRDGITLQPFWDDGPPQKVDPVFWWSKILYLSYYPTLCRYLQERCTSYKKRQPLYWKCREKGAYWTLNQLQSYKQARWSMKLNCKS